MIVEGIKIGLTAGVAVVFFIIGIIVTIFAVGALLDLILLPFRWNGIIKRHIERKKVDEMIKNDPIFSMFKR